eukprot:m.159328 g.159328  ORF g.159328 m.159328 type:complete len:231 (-) comp17999_c0_seq1:1767-2459(-)
MNQRKTLTTDGGPMFRVTENIAQLVKDVLATESSNDSGGLQRSLKELALTIDSGSSGGTDSKTTRTISFSAIQALMSHMKEYREKNKNEKNKKSLYLHEVLNGNEIVVQAPKKSEPHPELVERRKKLQMMADEMEYQRSVKHLDGKKRFGHEGAPLDIQDGKRVFSLVVSLLLTMGACFLFGWVAVGSTTSNVVMKTLSGVICMVVAVGAELYFLMRSSILTHKVKTHVD